MCVPQLFTAIHRNRAALTCEYKQRMVHFLQLKTHRGEIRAFMFKRLPWIKPNAFSITFQNTKHIYSELHLESGMADGKDTHTALDNPGLWQRPDCSLTLQDIPCLFPKEKFSWVAVTSGTFAPKRLSQRKWNVLHPSPQYQSNQYFHLPA